MKSEIRVLSVNKDKTNIETLISILLVLTSGNLRIFNPGKPNQWFCLLQKKIFWGRQITGNKSSTVFHNLLTNTIWVTYSSWMRNLFLPGSTSQAQSWLCLLLVLSLCSSDLFALLPIVNIAISWFGGFPALQSQPIATQCSGRLLVWLLTVGLQLQQ